MPTLRDDFTLKEPANAIIDPRKPKKYLFVCTPFVAHLQLWEAKTKAKKKSRRRRNPSQNQNPGANAKGSPQPRRSRAKAVCPFGEHNSTQQGPPLQEGLVASIDPPVK
jgi:hypothetical protein